MVPLAQVAAEGQRGPVQERCIRVFLSAVPFNGEGEQVVRQCIERRPGLFSGDEQPQRGARRAVEPPRVAVIPRQDVRRGARRWLGGIGAQRLQVLPHGMPPLL